MCVEKVQLENVKGNYYNYGMIGKKDSLDSLSQLYFDILLVWILVYKN